MKQKLILGILLAACAIGLAINVSTVVLREVALSMDSVWRFKIAGFDPLDPFRGRYLQFAVPGLLSVPESSAIEVNENAEKGDAFFAILERDEAGFGRIASVSTVRPEDDGSWLKIRYSGDGGIEALFDRYYVNEAKADELDAEFREKQGKAYITMKISNGVGVITGLGFED